jgi:AraC-like DNA-binding protein
MQYIPHQHHLYELICHQGGQGSVYIGNQIAAFSGPCAFLIAPDVPHTYNWEPDPGIALHECLILQSIPEAISRLQALAEGLHLTGPLSLAQGGAAICGAPAKALWAILARFPDSGPLGRHVILTEALELFASAAPQAIAPPLRPRSADPMARVLAWLQAHAHEAVTLAELGRIAGMHPRSVARAFRRATGQSVVSHLQFLRVARACELLATGAGDITACCYAAGFGNLSNFNRTFRRITGHTPSAFRRLVVG